MAIMRPRNDPVRLFWKRLALLGLFVLVVFAGGGVWSAYHKERESRVLRIQAQARLGDLSQQQNDLKSDIERLQTARGKEAVLREQYALAAKGEGVIVIVNASSSAESIATSSAFVEWLHNTFPWW